MIVPAPSASTIEQVLAPLGLRLETRLQRYAGSRRVDQQALAPSAEAELDFAGARWRLTTRQIPLGADGCELRIRAELRSGAAAQVALAVAVDYPGWSGDHYLLLPGAVYAANRFRCVPSNRWEQLPQHLPELGPDMPTTCTQRVPRLALEPGPSAIQLLAGDCSTPAIAVQDPQRGHGLLLLTEQACAQGDLGLALREHERRDRAELLVTAPGMREELTYNGRPSPDRAADLVAGEAIELRLRLHVFPCTSIEALFARVFAQRGDLRGEVRRRCDIPFAATWAIQQDKYNRENWTEPYGYYSVGMRESRPQDWQSGWVGGLNTTYALLAEGDATTVERTLRSLDFCGGGASPSGFIWNTFHRGEWLGQLDGQVFLRYSADGLYFLCKDLLLLRQRPPHRELPARWLELARGMAEAFCRMWERHGQLAQFADGQSGEPTIGETACAGLAPGALALAAQLFDQPRYLAVARAAARRYRQRFIARGITTGGPGDIIQGVDSESCFGLLEAYVTLHDETGEAEWLEAAEACAWQCASWVVSYDFRFPPQSTFGRLDLLTTGTVIANIQNKHSAPGICTLSGVSLLKLFRATGETRYLDLLVEIAHAIPQYCSRADRPITDRRPRQRWPVLPPGWINERVNMSDWEERDQPDEEIRVGEVFGGSTWSEAAMLLTVAEVPGIYLQTDTLLLRVIDHVHAEILRVTPHELTLRLCNPTAFDAEVKLLAERSSDCARPLGPLPTLDCPRIPVPAGQLREFVVAR